MNATKNKFSSGTFSNILEALVNSKGTYVRELTINSFIPYINAIHKAQFYGRIGHFDNEKIKFKQK